MDTIYCYQYSIKLLSKEKHLHTEKNLIIIFQHLHLCMFLGAALLNDLFVNYFSKNIPDFQTLLGVIPFWRHKSHLYH